MSIHFMESAAERQLFEELDGPLMEFIRDIGAVFQAIRTQPPGTISFKPNRKA